MKEGKQSKMPATAILPAAVLTAAILTGYSAWKLVGTGVLSWHVRQPEFLSMTAELAVVCLLFFLLFFYERDVRIWLAGVLILGGGFAWLHVVFLPMVVSGLYVCYLTGIGGFTGRRLIRRDMGGIWNFMLGTAVTISVFCLLSLFKLGSIRNLRLWTLGSGALLIPPAIRRIKDAASRAGSFKPHLTAGQAFMLAAILTLVFLQMGRMNVAVDFDSIWYGVRSDVMLDGGSGIYENLGTLGVVYTYSKGWETLTLPLAGLPSYSFLIAFNLWTSVLMLAAVYQTACVKQSRAGALWVPFLIAAVPGIMNMGGTAKADMLTLFYQILMVQGILQYENNRRGEWLVMSMAAGIISLTMKPTTVIYSTAIIGMGLVWLIWDRWLRRDQKNRQLLEMPSYAGEWLLLVPCFAALAGIWGRTLKLVGVPVTSVFYQVFQKLGFQVKYPFYASGFPAAAGNRDLSEKLSFFARRLYGVLLNPQGEDMGHVIIAWGTVIPLVFFLMWLVSAAVTRYPKSGGRLDSRAEARGSAYLAFLIPAVLVINLVSLYSLSQIDGNYYMLFYMLVILAGCMALQGGGAAVWRASVSALLPAWLLAALLCCLTNWAWALGMEPIRPVNRGYYNHLEAEREKRFEQGSGAIWEILASDPENRVIALGETPGVLTFPCSVQSYVDVSGYWGNPEVVSSAPEFLRYLQYAGTDYLYMEKEYVDASVRIYQIVRTLVEDGWLTDVRDENGNLILTVAKEGPQPDMAERNLEVFDSRYIQHP